MRRVMVGAVIAGLAVLAVAPCFGVEDGDWQLWTGAGFVGALDESRTVRLDADLRFRDDVEEAYYQSADVGMEIEATDWLDLGVNFRRVSEKIGNEWLAENRPHLNGTLKWLLGNLQVRDRNRIEYRNREIREDRWRYRNEFSISLPVTVADVSLQPYVAEELFYDFDESGVRENRLRGGFTARVREHLQTDLFFLWRAEDIADKWMDSQVFGIRLNGVF